MPEDDIKLVGNLEIHNKENYVIKFFLLVKYYAYSNYHTASFATFSKFNHAKASLASA